eukprot:scaffold19225_cov107-Isochrysis_galbana.AAC.2
MSGVARQAHLGGPDVGHYHTLPTRLPPLSTAHANPRPQLLQARPWRRGSRGWNKAASANRRPSPRISRWSQTAAAELQIWARRKARRQGQGQLRLRHVSARHPGRRRSVSLRSAAGSRRTQQATARTGVRRQRARAAGAGAPAAAPRQRAASRMARTASLQPDPGTRARLRRRRVCTHRRQRAPLAGAGAAAGAPRQRAASRTTRHREPAAGSRSPQPGSADAGRIRRRRPSGSPAAR